MITISEIKISRQLIITGLSGAIAVGLGAFGAHGLKQQVTLGTVTVDQLNGFDTAVRYQMYHTLAMLIVIFMGEKFNPVYLRRAWMLFLAGIVFFSGSLYLLCTRGLTGMEFLKVLGPVTPIGGMFFIAGWLFLAFSFSKKS